MLKYTLSIEGYTEPSRFLTGFYPDEFQFFRGLDVPTNHHCNYEYFNKMHVIMNCHPLGDLMIKFQDFEISYLPVLQR